MTMYTIVIFLIAPVLLWATFCYIFPAAARARFVSRVEAVHDAIDDAIIKGDLPDEPPVRELMDLCDFMAFDAKSLSISTLWAVDRAHRQMPAQLRPRRTRTSYAHLTTRQRKMMHEFDLEVTNALGGYLIAGSKLAVPMFAVMFFLRHSTTWNKKWRSNKEAPHPSKLAHNFVKVPTSAPRQITGTHTHAWS